MDFGIVSLLAALLIGYLIGRRHAGGARDIQPGRSWRMRADNNVSRRPLPSTRDGGGSRASRSTAQGGVRRGLGGFMDTLQVESLVSALPPATQQLVLEGDRKSAARSLAAAYPTVSPHVISMAIITWAARNGAR